MKNKIVIFVFCLCLVVPFSASAQTGGYFHNTTLPYLAGGLTTTRATDGLTSTGYLNTRYSTNIPVYTFDQPENIRKVYLNGTACMQFFSDVNHTKEIKRTSLMNNSGGWFDLSVDNVRSFYPSTCGDDTNRYLYELDVIVESQMVYNPVGSIESSSNHNSIFVSWKNDKNEKTLISVDGKQVASLDNTVTDYKITNLKPDTSYDVGFVADYGNGNYSKPEIRTIRTQKTPTVGNLKATNIKYNSATLEWSVPSYNDFQKVYVIDETGTKISINDNSYALTNLKADTTYKYVLVAVYGGYESDPVSVEFKTLEKPKNVGEVDSLKAEPSWDKVDLSWDLKNVATDRLDHINIYRKLKVFLGLGISEKIGTTKGETYTDNSVKSASEYEYTITTTSVEGIESDGISVTTKTLEEPKVEDVKPLPPEKLPNGDYLFKWTEPTTGKVKILIGGKEFTTVPASDKQILIKKQDLKYDVFGNPDVKLIAVSENGMEGKPINPNNPDGGFGGINEGLKDVFSINSLLLVSVALLALVGGIVLLRMSFLVTPKLIELIKGTQKTNVQEGRRWKK